MKATFAADVRAPAHARRFVSGQLREVVDPGEPPEGDDVVLIVSELVTNSLRAGAERIDVSLRATRDRVELEVTDDADGWPAPRKSGLADEGGRGLAIVEELADTWEATRHGRGKRVTATWFRPRR